MAEAQHKIKISELTDDEIVSILRVGSTIEQKIKGKAFDELIKRHSKKIYTVILQMVRNETDSWDVSQEAFIRIHRSIPFFRGDSKLFSWMHTIASNAARDFLRAQKRRRRREGPSLDDTDTLSTLLQSFAVSSGTPHEDLINAETKKLLQLAVDELSNSHKEIIVLRYYMGMDYCDISQLLNIQEGTIRSRVHYAQKKLANIMQGSKKETLLKKISRTFSRMKASCFL